MKRDYSQCMMTDYDIYLIDRSNSDEIVDDYFQNYVVFDNVKKEFFVEIDFQKEYHHMFGFIEQYDMMMNADIKSKLEKRYKPYPQGYLGFIEGENIKYYNILINSYDIEKYDFSRDSFYRSNPQYFKRPYLNVLSGHKVKLSYGEGILDFIYADFFSSCWDQYENFVCDPREDDYDSRYHNSESITVYNELQDKVELLYDFERTMHSVYKIVYSSIYTAICPPRFEKDFDPYVVIEWYADRLQVVQSEFLWLIEFCYDEDYLPEILGKMTPQERFHLFKKIHRHKLEKPRKEILSFVRTSAYDENDCDIEKKEAVEFAFKYDQTKFLRNSKLSLEELLDYTMSKREAVVKYAFSSVFELLELEFSKMLETNIRFKKCKRCGRYFVVKGNYNTNYCDRIENGSRYTCQELAATENYKAKLANNKALSIYNKYYKRYRARVKVNQIKEPDFKDWKLKALVKRNDCDNGTISPEEYEAWNESYFPNRKKKENK